MVSVAQGGHSSSKLRDNSDVPRLLSPVRSNTTNKGSSFPKIPLGCLRDELPEAGEGSRTFLLPGGHGRVLAVPPTPRSSLLWLKLAKWVMNQNIFCSCSGKRKFSPTPQHSDVGLEETLHLSLSGCFGSLMALAPSQEDWRSFAFSIPWPTGISSCLG